ncbi:MAG: THO complex subunit 2 [Bathelium mastoideum]|nr:MAG: THO complex subunit 2 [Bathelium mastoideum]
MAPNSQKRKRDASYAEEGHDASSRPSPHRPQNLGHAQQNLHNMQHTRGGRRNSRQVRGGANSNANSNANPMPAPSPTQLGSHPNSLATSSTAMSPPSIPSPSPRAASMAKTERTVAASAAPASVPSTSAKSDLVPYYYQNLNEYRRKEWSSIGRAATVQEACQARDAGNTMELSTTFQELVRAGLDGLLDPTDVGKTIQEIVGDVASESNSAAILFLDCVAIMTEDDVRQTNLPTLMFATGISPALMRSRLDSSLLVALALVRGSFPSQQVRTQTSIYYKQGNYNLLREESEGYAKLMTEYFTTVFSAPPTADLVHDTFTKVLGMIGAFDLDVGRVLDVTLDVFANLLLKHYRFFIKFLVASSWWPNNKSFDGIEAPNYPYDNLPPWALPNYASYSLTQTDRERLEIERRERDVQFWNRVREIGMNAYCELGGRQVVMDEESASQLQAKLDKEIKEFEEDQKRASEEAAARGRKAQTKEVPRNFSREWIAGTRTLPPRGNFEAAQLLGFKLRFYSSEDRDPDVTFPENLIYLAALLIKIGFISLKDLYPHLHPPDSAMDAVRETKMKEKAERIEKSSMTTENALTRAAPLTDDEPTTTTATRLRNAEARATPKSNGAQSPSYVDEEPKKTDLPEPADQKVLLLKSLLAIGAIPEALYILGRFPWLIDAYPDILKYIHRILDHSLSKLYEDVNRTTSRASLHEAQNVVVDLTAASTSELQTSELSKRRVVRWAQLDKVDSGEIDYRYYWEHWTDDVPVCQSIDDLFTLCATFLNFSGVRIGQDTPLFLKLVRIANKSLIDDSSAKNRARWTDLVKRVLLPALSFVKANPAAVDEVWSLLKQFETATRFNMYAEWFIGATSRNPDIQEAFSQAKLETSRTTKRISVTTLKSAARSLAKIALSCPGVVFQVAFREMETYEYLITGFAEIGRLLHELAYDVLTWSLLNAIGGGTRSRVQADGMLTSSWLKAISMFTGGIFKRFSKMNTVPILQYVAHQLRRGQSTELEVLEQLVWSAAGIATEMNVSDKDILAMAGGPTLRAQTLISLGDERNDKHRPESSQRLIQTLNASGLTSQFLIAIVQERQTYGYRQSSSKVPLKVLGNNLDKIHRVYGQYLEMLRSGLTTSEFDQVIPDVVSLVSDFGLETSFAFEIVRPSLAEKISLVDAAVRLERRQEQARADSTEKARLNEDVEMSQDAVEAVPSSSSGVIESSPVKVEDGKKEEGEESDDYGADVAPPKDAPRTNDQAPLHGPELAANDVSEPWHPVLKPLIQDLRPLVRSDLKTSSAFAFYVTFWQLSVYDLLVPTASYQDEITELRSKVLSTKADRKDISVDSVAEKERKIKGLSDLQDQLREEMKFHVEAYQQIRNRLNSEKDFWFPGLDSTRQSLDSLNMALLQDCFFPRMVLSPLDAQYTYKMVFYLHSSATPGFRTMFLLDSFFKEKQLTALMFQCTVTEAENLGRFLHELLKELNKWHADKAYYEKQAFGAKKDLPGFATKISDKGIETFREYEDYRRALFKWHLNLNAALKACFGSGEYMRIKNAIVILKAIYMEFPKVTFMGNSQLSMISALARDDRRSDLQVAATTLLGSFRSREKSWVMPQAFHINETAGSGPRSSSQVPSAKPSTPQAGVQHQESSSAKPLNTSAVDDISKVSSLPNGTVRKTVPSGKGDAEDGEIEDEKSSKPAPNDTLETDQITKTKPLDQPMKSEQKERKTPDAPGFTPKLSTQASSNEQIQIASDAENSELKEVPVLSASAAPAAKAQAKPQPPSSGPARTPHQLPNRPEQPPRRIPERGPERPRDIQGGRRDGRSTQREDYGRLDRPTDLGRSNINGNAARREPSPGRRGRRTPERPMHPDHGRSDYPLTDARDRQADYGPRPSPRDHRSSDTRVAGRVSGGYESVRERPSDHSRDFVPPPEKRSRTTPSSSMGPPASNALQPSDNHGSVHPDRASQTQQSELPNRASSDASPFESLKPVDDRLGMNPQRAALMSADLHQDPRTHDSPRERPSRHNEKDRRPSYDVDDHRRERQAFDGPSHIASANVRDRREEVGPPPSGPRGGRRSERELFDTNVAPRSTNEQNMGRLTQEYPPARPSQDPNYGRLNPQPDVPLGPRGRNPPGLGRGGRNFTAPQPSINTQIPNNEASMPSPAPQSPSQQRNQTPLRPFRDRNSQSERLPTTPAAATPASATSRNAAGDLAGVHPSRLGQVQPSPIRTDTPSFSQSTRQSPASASGMPPPSGPRMQQQHSPVQTHHPTTDGFSSNSRNVPTGPSSSGPSNDRQRNNDARKFAGVQEVLSQAGSPATQVASSERSGSTTGSSAAAATAPASLTASSNRAGNMSIRGQASSGARPGPAQGSQVSGSPGAASASSQSLPSLRSGSGAGGEGLPPRPPSHSASEVQSQRGELLPGRSQDDRNGGRRAADGRREEQGSIDRSIPLARERPGPRHPGPREQSERHTERDFHNRRGDERDRDRGREYRDRKSEHHPGFERMPTDRDLREGAGRRARDEGSERVGPPGGSAAAGMPRSLDGGGRRPPMLSEMDHGYGGGGWGGYADGRSGDMRMRGPQNHMGPPSGGDGRRDDRDRVGRDMRKRRGDEAMHGDNKRSRRSG